MSRRKEVNESHIDYYNAKMELLKRCNITGIRAVSCLIAGLSKALRTSLRNRRPHSPEQVREYLEFIEICRWEYGDITAL